MVVLLVGDAFYLVGNMYYILHHDCEDDEDSACANYRLSYFTTLTYSEAEGCSFIVDWETVAFVDMFQMLSIAETLLTALTVLFFAVDLWKNMMQDAKKRALVQGGVLFVVSVMQFI